MWIYIFITIITLIIIYVFVLYNNFIKLNNKVKEAFSTMDVYLKKRWDLIPNLVNTVKGYAAHESQVFSKVAESRSKLSGAMNSNDIKAIQQSNNELNSALSRLLMVVERYPTLKADKSFIALQDELSGTENRIAVARKDYNDSVKELNSAIRRFPTSIIAAISGIKSRDYFEISEAEKAVPQVKF